jgi:arylsulfatase A-like enzyme
MWNTSVLMRIQLLALAALVLLASCQSETAPPNIVVVMTDDQGYGDFGFMGNPVIQTPEIDKMASRSASMERFYVSPVCAPTRASLVTGRYNYRTRAIDTYLGRAMMEPEETTIAELLSGAGYATGIFGKWHLGDSYPLRPQDQGFQEVLVHRGGGIGQPSDPPGGEGKYTDPILFHNGEQKQMEGYCTDIYFDAAMRFLETNQQAGQPAFVYLPTNAPHGPFDDVPDELYQMYSKMDLRPTLAGELSDEQYEKLHDRTARTLAMITNVDQNMGRLFAHLERIGAYENTLVIFLVDNGPNGPRYVGDLRGQKTETLQGGIRSPFLAHWPARLAAGQTSDRIAAHIDILPTVLEAAGVDKPAELHLDGRSLLPLLEGRQVDWPDRTIVIQSHRGDVPSAYRNFAAVTQDWAIRQGRFGGNEQGDPAGIELYHLAEDPGERTNLAAERTDKLAELREAYDAWFEDVSSTRPDNYAPPRIHIGTPHENPVVLTRQDWRQQSDGDGWAPGAVGNWVLHVAAAGSYEIRCTFNSSDEPETLTVKVAGSEQTASIEAGATEHTFAAAELSAGDTTLDAALTKGRTTRGGHHVYVTRK